MQDSETEPYKRIDIVEKDVGHMGVEWRRTQWSTGKVAYQFMIRTNGGYAFFTPEEFRAVMREGENMFRSLGGWPHGE